MVTEESEKKEAETKSKPKTKKKTVTKSSAAELEQLGEGIKNVAVGVDEIVKLAVADVVDPQTPREEKLESLREKLEQALDPGSRIQDAEESVEEVEKRLIKRLYPRGTGTPPVEKVDDEYNVVEEEPDPETEFLQNVGNADPSFADPSFVPTPERQANTPQTAVEALQAQQEEDELRKFEEANKKLEASYKVAKKRKLTPVTLKVTGEMLELWHAMKDGMRASMLTRPGISAVEKALFSAMPITDEVALKYLLSLHDEEIERQQETRRAMLQPVLGQPQLQPQQLQPQFQGQPSVPVRVPPPQGFITPDGVRAAPRARLDSDNPQSMLGQQPPVIVPERGPGGIGVSEVTVGGQPMSEKDFFQMVATRKPKKVPKKRAYQ